MLMQKTGVTYDPMRELGCRWPDWRVVHVPTRGFEIILSGPQLVMIDCAADDQEMELAHALAHLDLHMDVIQAGCGFSDDEEWQADWLARVRLDRLWCRNWEDVA